jgi:hypothetical protein
LENASLYSGSAAVSDNGPDINDRGQGIATLTNASGRQVIVDRQGRNIATAPNMQTLLLDATLNNNGVVAFTSYRFVSGINQRSAIRVGSQPGNLRTLIDTETSEFSRVGSPRLNDFEDVVFEATLDSGLIGIFRADDSGTRAVFVDNDEVFGELRNPGINNRGEVAFLGYDPIAETGAIYTGPDLAADRVIGPGDRLSGLRVQSVYFVGEINNAGQIAFSAVLGDGTEAIFRADPIVQNLAAVPEPRLLALVAPLLLLTIRTNCCRSGAARMADHAWSEGAPH